MSPQRSHAGWQKLTCLGHIYILHVRLSPRWRTLKGLCLFWPVLESWLHGQYSGSFIWHESWWLLKTAGVVATKAEEIQRRWSWIDLPHRWQGIALSVRCVQCCQISWRETSNWVYKNKAQKKGFTHHFSCRLTMVTRIDYCPNPARQHIYIICIQQPLNFM